MADAETYDTYLVPALFEPWSRELINRSKVWKGDRVLDIACGTGIVACRIAGTGATVAAIDLDPDRLEYARRRADDEGVSIKWIEGNAERLPMRQPAFDLVTCQQGLQFMGDKKRVVAEIRRVLAPGGRAVLACWCPIEEQSAFRIVDDIAHQHTGHRHVHPFSFGDRALLQQLLAGAKFSAVTIERVTRTVRIPQPERFATMALTTLGGRSADELAPAIAEATAALSQLVDGDQLVFPMTSLIAIARVPA